MEKTTSVKFFWNGLRLNGSKKLVKCFYSLDNRHDGRECVVIYARGYGDKLPGDLFLVENGTDTYTDYFEMDKAYVFPDHPLYPFIRVAAVAAQLRTERKWGSLEKVQALEAELSTLPKTQPTAADLEAVHARNLAAETACLAAEHEAELARREEALHDRNEGKIIKVEFAPWVEQAVTAYKAELARRSGELRDLMGMLTEEQLAAAVFQAPPQEPDIARFFLQQLMDRDEQKAREVFRAWSRGEGIGGVRWLE